MAAVLLAHSADVRLAVALVGAQRVDQPASTSLNPSFTDASSLRIESQHEEKLALIRDLEFARAEGNGAVRTAVTGDRRGGTYEWHSTAGAAAL